MRRNVLEGVLFMMAAVFILTMPGRARAESVDERLRKLEKDQAEIYHTLDEKKKAGLMTQISERITMSGLIEVELFFENLALEGGSEDISDVELATVQLGFEASVAENIDAALILLYEEGGSGDLEVDEATIDYGRGGWTGRFGKQYVPFGTFPSHFISGPLTQELGETGETALLLGYGTDLFSVSIFAGKGDAGVAEDEDTIDDWGASLTVTPPAPVVLGASYTSDLADTDAELAASYLDRVGGWSVYGVVQAGVFEVSAEYLAATERFNAADLDADGDGRGDQPSSWNVELAWHPRDNVELGGRIEGSDEFGGHPEVQYGAGVSWGPRENVSLSLEYLRGEFDSSFGDGVEDRNLVVTQLAVEF